MSGLAGARVGLNTAIAVYCAANAYQVARERRFLRRQLEIVLGRPRIQSRDDLVKIKNFLTETIDYESARHFDRRPVLRASAEQTLLSGFGFCGESARAAVMLLDAGGVQARRLYLEGEKWGHVVVEHEWDGDFKLFDAHRDPGTILPDELVAELPSRDIARLPNEYTENPWRRSYRIKPLNRVPATRRFSTSRLPRVVALLGESPASLRFAVGLAAALPLVLGRVRRS